MASVPGRRFEAQRTGSRNINLLISNMDKNDPIMPPGISLRIEDAKRSSRTRITAPCVTGVVEVQQPALTLDLEGLIFCFVQVSVCLWSNHHLSFSERKGWKASFQ